jgi:hypothetical protein
MMNSMMKIAGVALLGIAAAGLVLADGTVPAPEINASTAGNALALLSGAVLMIRGRKK